MSKFSQIYLATCVSVFMFLRASSVFAQAAVGTDDCGGFKICNPLKGSNNLYEFIKNVVDNVVLPIGGVVAVLAIIYSGYLFVTAVGNEEKLKTAKMTLWYSVIGTAILLGAWVIATGIEATINQLTNI